MLLSIEPNEYQLYGHFKGLIKRAEKDLHKHTDIYFTFEEEIVKRKVVSITFYIYENAKNQRVKITPPIEQSVTDATTPKVENISDLERIYDKVKQYVSKTKVKKWLNEVAVEQVENAIIYTINHIQAGNKVANIGGFLNTMVHTPNLYDKYEAKKTKSKKVTVAQQEQTQAVESKKQELQQLRGQFEQLIVELEKGYFASNPNLGELIATKIQANRFYNHKLTLEQNLQQDSIKGLRGAILGQMFPEYQTLSEQYYKKVETIKEQMRMLGYRD
jgi:plasmid replication initiation protein